MHNEDTVVSISHEDKTGEQETNLLGLYFGYFAIHRVCRTRLC
jgi:hypothetical protein